jgi:hypothetical protein
MDETYLNYMYFVLCIYYATLLCANHNSTKLQIIVPNLIWPLFGLIVTKVIF